MLTNAKRKVKFANMQVAKVWALDQAKLKLAEYVAKSPEDNTSEAYTALALNLEYRHQDLANSQYQPKK